MSVPSPEAIERLIEAASALLEARTNEMVTMVEWRSLRDALAACGRAVQLEDADTLD